ncbi:MAG: ribose 5-phosphate isomerase A [Deltaproteobacteria bacterium]|nr:ribose 5-phosphate isomerase A [Deltaproteobacteria bacterium]
MNAPIQDPKFQSAKFALRFLQSGFTVALGSGSTAEVFVKLLAEQIHLGQLNELTLLSSSERTSQLAHALGLTLTPLAKISHAEIGIDGADEVSLSTRYVIKGGGGCALRERLAAELCQRFVIIADASKRSHFLGEKWAVPIDVHPDCLESITKALHQAGASAVELRLKQGQPFITDDHNYILDTHFGKIADPATLATTLEKLKPDGLVGHGLFEMPTDLVLASSETVQHWSWNGSAWQTP